MFRGSGEGPTDGKGKGSPKANRSSQKMTTPLHCDPGKPPALGQLFLTLRPRRPSWLQPVPPAFPKLHCCTQTLSVWAPFLSLELQNATSAFSSSKGLRHFQKASFRTSEISDIPGQNASSLLPLLMSPPAPNQALFHSSEMYALHTHSLCFFSAPSSPSGTSVLS